MKRQILTALVLGVVMLPETGSAQYQPYGPRIVPQPRPPLIYRQPVPKLYNWGNSAYQHGMARRGVPNPGMIGSDQFWRRNLPPPNWNQYSQRSFGIFQKPRHCAGPHWGKFSGWNC